MKKKRGWILVLLLALGLTLAACSAVPGMGEKKTEFEVGDKVSAYWFDFTVNGVETTDSYGGYEAKDGYRLVVCDMTIKNTFGDVVPMNWADFALLWVGEGESDSSADTSLSSMDGSYPIPQSSDEQLPDEYEVEKGETREGVLVFEVPNEVTKAAVVFQELYAEGESESKYSEGDHYMVWLSL
ncbi:MAG: DUF4352 domain-containing protein [Lawsonibacter sp.]|nr:DUF4352 domain-containing protein [Lawsonibacter sp.]